MEGFAMYNAIMLHVEVDVTKTLPRLAGGGEQ